MKKIIAISLFAASVLFLASCEKEHASNQKITYYPVMTLAGGDVLAWQVGEKFVDPGFEATLQGKDISSEVVVSGVEEVDYETSGLYYISYSYTNVDGFTNSTTRTVVVYDIEHAGETDLAGSYKMSWVRPATSTTFDKGYVGTITNGPAKGLFYMSDLLSGFYDKYYQYGSGYAFQALILLKGDNTISLLTTEDPGWGYAIEQLEDCEYVPETNQVKVNWFWSGWLLDIYTTYTLSE